MSTPIRSRLHLRKSPSARSAFTLIELLVVMGIIGLLGVITAMSFHAIAKDAKLSSGKNALMAVLDNARGLAMKENQVVVVAFRPRLDGKKQYVEAVFAKWTGESALANKALPNGTFLTIIDRFAPLADVPSRRLPDGIKVGGPNFFGTATGGSTDTSWIVQSHLPAIDQLSGNGEVPGQLIAVMYGPDGTTLTQNPNSDATRSWIDFNNDPTWPAPRQSLWPSLEIKYFEGVIPTITDAGYSGGYFEQRLEGEEPFIRVVPFLAVFDDDLAREKYDPNMWNTTFSPSAAANHANNYTAYITQYADRIHFNRYTGVVMK